MIPRMEQSSNDWFEWFSSLGGVFLTLIVFGFIAFWLLIAAVAFLVAPDDRPWDFFWCTLLILGPLGIAMALVAPARPLDDEDD